MHRYAPDGLLERALATPVPHPTKCAFGGMDLRDLYVTSAFIQLNADERAHSPLAGALFHIAPGVAGRAPKVFG